MATSTKNIGSKHMNSDFLLKLMVVVLFSLTVRIAVSTWGHSGEGKPPMHGDFEAQRHWMELTVNLPTSEWYVDTPHNDLQYWGLDYPPLTAYHMMINGKVAQYVNSSIVALNESRGIETPQVKIFMRLSVLVMDALIFLPAVAAFFMIYKSRKSNEDNLLPNILVVALYPGIILVDNGHFQYNNVSLGLVIWASCAFARRDDIIGAVLFCFALNYKQMELYHALPFFAYLFGSCFRQKSVPNGLYKFVCLGLVVVISFTLIWAPFLNDVDSALAVLQRLFPFNRGLYEDKVANFWCAASIVIKFKDMLPVGTMALVCLMSVAVLSLPSFIHLLLNPNVKNFLYGLINSSLVFFLFSFHVHEKSILLAAIPACLLLETDGFAIVWFLLISIFSMLPLLIKDGLLVPTIATTALFWIIANYTLNEFQGVKTTVMRMFEMSILGAVGLSLGLILVTPPQRYPDLFTLLIAIYSCVHFILFALHFHVRQIYSVGKRKYD